MQARRLAVVALLGAALAGCSSDERDREGGTVEADDASVPEGAIPAAPDMRPGSPAVQGGVSQTGATTDSVSNEAPAAGAAGTASTTAGTSP